MTDLIDTANNKAAAWADESIKQVRKLTQPNDVLDCTDCGKEIGSKRKKAVPFATRCIQCQSKFEESIR